MSDNKRKFFAVPSYARMQVLKDAHAQLGMQVTVATRLAISQVRIDTSFVTRMTTDPFQPMTSVRFQAWQ